jgi:hypothetical protein
VNPTELNVLRKQTTAYIAANPVAVALVRTVLVDDGAGGKKPASVGPLSPQTVRIIQQNDLRTGVERRTVAGEVVRPTLAMLTEWNANVEEGDTFTWNDLSLEVVWITDLGYEKTCEVATV